MAMRYWRRSNSTRVAVTGSVVWPVSTRRPVGQTTLRMAGVHQEAIWTCVWDTVETAPWRSSRVGSCVSLADLHQKVIRTGMTRCETGAAAAGYLSQFGYSWHG